jgi:hypothetical protein
VPTIRSGVVVSTYVAPAEAAELRTRAAQGDRSVAAELRRAVRSYLTPVSKEIELAGGGLDSTTSTAAAGPRDDVCRGS